MKLKDRYAAGKAQRAQLPRESHAEWKPAPHRADPIDLLVESSRGRVPELVPIRYGRMLQSPFTFYRGAAAVMAADLAATPATGMRVQACGDCHLLNFGGFATPERRLIFDINDFDETLPALWEWDIKRLAASVMVAGRNNDFKAKHCRRAALASVRAYRKGMAEFAGMRAMEVWYASVTARDARSLFGEAERRAVIRKRMAKLQQKGVVEHDFPKLTALRDGRPVIRDNPPLIYHQQEAAAQDFEKRIRDALALYRSSLSEDRRVLLDRYRPVDFAMKVVGVGSVGTRCGVLLLMASERDPLFLQVKEARASVLEPYAGAGTHANRGQRVVIGQRLMQSATDVLLGWTETEQGHFYVRQLHDMKFTPVVETFDPASMADYAALCGWSLARAHARSGDAGGISGYMGKSGVFDEAVADFTEAYADQNERDHAALVAAVRSGRVEARLEG